MNVPLLDLKAQWTQIEQEVRAAVDRVWDSQRFIMGPEIETLERDIARYTGTRHAIAVSSGTDAILCALMSLHIGPGDEVIVPPFTFFATGGCVSRVGARPVFVDVEPDTYNIDPNLIERAISPRTKAIMPVHLFGQCAAMEPILEIAQRRGIPVIEDAAQAIGAKRHGKSAGGFGLVACFSFFPSKNLGGAGDGGIIVTNDDALGERMAVMRVHGGKPKYYHGFIGGNFRLDTLQAAVLIVKLRHLDGWHEARRRNATLYDELLAGTPVGRPSIADGNESIYNQYVIRCPRRDALREHLTKAGVGTEIYYPVPLHLQQCFADLGYKRGDMPVSERAADEVLAIPIYPELTRTQIEHVAQSISAFYKS